MWDAVLRWMASHMLILNRATSAKLLGGLMKYKLFIIFILLIGLVACGPGGGRGDGGDNSSGVDFKGETNGRCGGCCSWHGGVVCLDNGKTGCGDGSPLSSTCRSKGCKVKTCGDDPVKEDESLFCNPCYQMEGDGRQFEVSGITDGGVEFIISSTVLMTSCDYTPSNSKWGLYYSLPGNVGCEDDCYNPGMTEEVPGCRDDCEPWQIVEVVINGVSYDVGDFGGVFYFPIEWDGCGDPFERFFYMVDEINITYTPVDMDALRDALGL